MNGYMGLFLETGSPAFYMMAKQDGTSASAVSGGAAESAANIVPGGAAGRRECPTAKEGTSLR